MLYTRPYTRLHTRPLHEASYKALPKEINTALDKAFYKALYKAMYKDLYKAFYKAFYKSLHKAFYKAPYRALAQALYKDLYTALQTVLYEDFYTPFRRPRIRHCKRPSIRPWIWSYRLPFLWPRVGPYIRQAGQFWDTPGATTRSLTRPRSFASSARTTQHETETDFPVGGSLFHCDLTFQPPTATIGVIALIHSTPTAISAKPSASSLLALAGTPALSGMAALARGVVALAPLVAAFASWAPKLRGAESALRAQIAASDYGMPGGMAPT